MRPAAAFALAQPHVGKRVILDSPALPRQWVLSLPIPLRVLLPAQPQRLRPLLQVVHRVLTRFLLGQASLAHGRADRIGRARLPCRACRATVHSHAPRAGDRAPTAHRH